MKLLKYPNPFLFKTVAPVTKFNDQLKLETEEMFKIMSDTKGIGLAANQVGLDKQVFIMLIQEEKFVFINPKIITKSNENFTHEEGCLSFPELYFSLERATSITLKWQDLNEVFYTREFTDVAAVCVQHELDHLKGIVFIQHLGSAKKQIILNKYAKLAKKQKN